MVGRWVAWCPFFLCVGWGWVGWEGRGGRREWAEERGFLSEIKGVPKWDDGMVIPDTKVETHLFFLLSFSLC